MNHTSRFRTCHSSPGRTVARLTAAAMRAACVTTQTGRVGADDRSDSCRTLIVALDRRLRDHFAERPGHAAGQGFDRTGI